MSYAFDVRFDSTEMPLTEILDALAIVLEAREIVPQSVSSLMASNGRPTVDLRRRVEIPIDEGGLRAVGSHVTSWWGLNVYCVSTPIARRLGRGDATEVDFAIFPTGPGKRTLKYKESSRVFESRLDDEDAENELYALQLMLCAALSFTVSDYDEEGSSLTREPFASLHEAERLIERAVDRGVPTSVVVAHSLLGLARAQELAKGRADDVRLSANGYLLFRFLHRVR
jgi:hypothetical protein